MESDVFKHNRNVAVKFTSHQTHGFPYQFLKAAEKNIVAISRKTTPTFPSIKMLHSQNVFLDWKDQFRSQHWKLIRPFLWQSITLCFRISRFLNYIKDTASIGTYQVTGGGEQVTTINNVTRQELLILVVDVNTNGTFTWLDLILKRREKMIWMPLLIKTFRERK